MTDRESLDLWIGGDFSRREGLSNVFPYLAAKDELDALRDDLNDWISTVYNPGTDHTHPISEIDGLAAALDGKAPLSHSHIVSDITNLQTILTGLQTQLDGKIAKSPKADAIANTTSSASADSITILGISVPTNASYLALVAAHNALKDKVNVILAALRSRDIING